MITNTQILTIHITQTKTQKVGTLATKNKKIYFEYDKAFLKTGIELSPYKLPLKAGLFECRDDTFDGLWGVFADSLPDGRVPGREHLRQLGVRHRIKGHESIIDAVAAGVSQWRRIARETGFCRRTMERVKKNMTI